MTCHLKYHAGHATIVFDRIGPGKRAFRRTCKKKKKTSNRYDWVLVLWRHDYFSKRHGLNKFIWEKFPRPTTWTKLYHATYLDLASDIELCLYSDWRGDMASRRDHLQLWSILPRAHSSLYLCDVSMNSSSRLIGIASIASINRKLSPLIGSNNQEMNFAWSPWEHSWQTSIVSEFVVELFGRLLRKTAPLLQTLTHTSTHTRTHAHTHTHTYTQKLTNTHSYTHKKKNNTHASTNTHAHRDSIRWLSLWRWWWG